MKQFHHLLEGELLAVEVEVGLALNLSFVVHEGQQGVDQQLSRLRAETLMVS